MRRRVPVIVMAAAVVAAACRDDRAPAADPVTATFTVAATGDVLVHDVVARRAADAAAAAGAGAAYDFGPLLAGVGPAVAAADLAVCHLESPLAADASATSFGPRYRAPGALAAALAATGWDACSTASNHALDAGDAGVQETLDLLDAAGVAHAGTARDAAEAARPVLVPVAGATVGLLAYTEAVNDVAGPAGGPAFRLARLDGERVLADARALRRAGADVVVVGVHWGTEYAARPGAGQRSLARRLLGSGAVDLLLGHHPHVVQPVERIAGRWAVYSLGNLLTGQADRCCPSPSDGVVVQVTMERTAAGWRSGALTFSPTVVERPGFAARLVAGALGESAGDPARRAALAASWCRTVAAVTAYRERDVAVAPSPHAPACRGAGGPAAGAQR